MRTHIQSQSLSAYMKSSFILFLSASSLLLACADPQVIVQPESMEMQPSPANPTDCPPELQREDGSCWTSDPSAYNEYVEMNGTCLLYTSPSPRD